MKCVYVYFQVHFMDGEFETAAKVYVGSRIIKARLSYPVVTVSGNQIVQ